MQPSPIANAIRLVLLIIGAVVTILVVLASLPHTAFGAMLNH